MKTPAEIAAEIVNQFPYSDNRAVNGRLVATDHLAAKAIADAIAADRKMVREQAMKKCAAIADARQMKDRKRWKDETDWRQPYAANRVIRVSMDIASEIRKAAEAEQS